MGCPLSKPAGGTEVAAAVEPHSYWDTIGCTALKVAHRDADLIDAAWLLECAVALGVLPRCQEVPAHAKVSLAQMEKWNEGGGLTVGVLVVS